MSVAAFVWGGSGSTQISGENGRYLSGVQVVRPRLPVSQDEVIRFLQSLLKSNTLAWQRLQAVRAIEAYRNLVLQTAVPSLHSGKGTGILSPRNSSPT